MEDHHGIVGKGSNGKMHMVFKLGRTWESENKCAFCKMLWWLENENDLVRPIWERRAIILTHMAAWIITFYSVFLALFSTLKFLALLVCFFFSCYSKTSEFTEAQQLLMSNVEQKMKIFYICKSHLHRSSWRLASVMWTCKRELLRFITVTII